MVIIMILPIGLARSLRILFRILLLFFLVLLILLWWLVKIMILPILNGFMVFPIAWKRR